jgi:hypothetical protein
VLDAELAQRAPDLRRIAAVHPAAGLQRGEVMAASVRIQAARQAVRRERLQQPGEGRRRPLLDHQNRRVDRTGGVIQRHHQVAGGRPRHPDVARRILMQHHPRQRPTRPPAPVRAASLRPRQQTAPLQQRLGPGITPAEALAHQMLVEVLGGEAGIAGPIQADHVLRVGRGRAVARRPSQPAVLQALGAALLIPLAPAAERPLADAEQLGRLELAELASVETLVNAEELHLPDALHQLRPAHQALPRESPASPDRSSAT